MIGIVTTYSPPFYKGDQVEVLKIDFYFAKVFSLKKGTWAMSKEDLIIIHNKGRRSSNDI